jgi:hypothetical protein
MLQPHTVWNVASAGRCAQVHVLAAPALNLPQSCTVHMGVFSSTWLTYLFVRPPEDIPRGIIGSGTQLPSQVGRERWICIERT